MEKEGWIALDIDGTITLDKYSVPEEVIHFFHTLHEKGWQFVLATGRPFRFASMALQKFDFPYLLLPQNGSIALEMPAKTPLFKSYISKTLIPVVEQAYEGIDSDFLIYAGYENGDACFYRPKRFAQDELTYLSDLAQRQKEEWHEVNDFRQLPLESFPLIKCFGPELRMRRVADRLRLSQHFEVAQIRDPFVLGTSILLVTDKQASKGKSLSKALSLKGRGKCVVAAGDDENDISLLETADIKIAMDHAPKQLTDIATFIAPPTKQNGIIQALEIALRKKI